MMTYQYAFCPNCKTVKSFTYRGNDSNCADMCCLDCHFVIATVFKELPDIDPNKAIRRFTL